MLQKDTIQWVKTSEEDIFIFFVLFFFFFFFSGFHCCQSSFILIRFASQGNFDLWNHSSLDAYDTMVWITSQPWSKYIFSHSYSHSLFFLSFLFSLSHPGISQNIFTTGASANGIACYLQASAQPHWIKAQSVIVGTANVHTSLFQVNFIFKSNNNINEIKKR